MNDSRKGIEILRYTKVVILAITILVWVLMLHYVALSNHNKSKDFSISFLFSSFYYGLTNIGDSSDDFVTTAASESVNDEYYELRKVLKEASTKDKTVILAFLNKAWAAPNSVFDLFLESFRIGNNTVWLLNHLLVVAVDADAYIRCQTSVFHCYFLNTNQSSELSSQATFMTPTYLDMIWTRISFCQTILSLGYNFLVTDSDIMWFRDPFPYLGSDSDIQTSCDYYYGNDFDPSNFPNVGFMLVRSNNRTIQFYKYWISSRHTYPHLHEQDVLNLIKYSEFIKELGLKIRYLYPKYMSGFCSPSKDFNKVITMHANCCIGLGNKTADLKTTLEDWKTYVASNGKMKSSTPSRWRIPNKCQKPEPYAF